MDNEILEKYKKYDVIIGVDEVGRGPIAGPVTVAAFGLEKKYYNDVLEKLSGITDSKKISEKRRISYTNIIKELKGENKLKVFISSVSACDIDKNGISNAIQSAMNRSVKKIAHDPENTFVYLDGSLYLDNNYHQETIIKGDSKNWLIGAASVIAKVTRDNQMINYAKKFPLYGFEKHKGYGTKGHYEKIKQHSVCELHRKTWIKY